MNDAILAEAAARAGAATPWGVWVGFGAFLAVMLVLDLGVFHRKAHAVSFREATIWTCVWVSLALLFNAGVFSTRGREAGLQFFTGYLIEWSLSMDNVFVFAVIFSFFSVPREFQHRVLFWGILGAVVMRLTFIFAGVALLNRFEWVIYIFGMIVLAGGLKMFWHSPEEIQPERNPVLRLARRFLRVTPDYHEQHFFVRKNGQWFATPLFLVLLVVEATDVVFAVDSIPAIFAITRDPFIVFSSNVFAILGLRALYFMLAAVMGIFRYLSKGLAVILCYIGVKMLASEWVHVPVAVTLGVVCGVLALAIGLSLYAARREAAAASGKRPGER